VSAVVNRNVRAFHWMCRKMPYGPDGTIAKMYRIAETATRRDERKTFRELIA
jgi:hypothetical protein